MKSMSLAATGLLLGTAAAAQDARVVTEHYDASHVIRLNGRTGIQSTIEFGDAESIENVAVGDSAAWQVTPNKRASLLFVKPMAAPARSNMTVVTSRRTYLFDLVSSPKAAPVYVMRFSNPPTRPLPANAPVQQAAAQPAKPPETTPADLNFAWASEGARQLLPQRLFDDGKATWLAWGRDVSMPAILVREPGGNEGPVNYTVKGDYVVVDGVPPQLVLRQGKLVATLTPTPRAARADPAPPLPAPAQVKPTAMTRTASTER